MAIYRNVQLSFWTDSKISDSFTPEDRFFYLYLITNPQSNICGCYEVSYAQFTNQTGYNKDTINRLIERFENVHNVIRFCKETKEILLLNWHKYNLNKSEKTLAGAENVAKYIKTAEFKEYVFYVINCIRNDSPVFLENTPIMGHPCPMQASVSVSDTASVSDAVSDIVSNTNMLGGIPDGHHKDKNIKYKKPEKATLAYFPNDELLDEAFRGYVAMRKQIKKPLTDRAIKLAISKLKEMAKLPFTDSIDSDTAIEILNQSVMNSWQGLFPLKNEHKKNNSKTSDSYDWDRI